MSSRLKSSSSAWRTSAENSFERTAFITSSSSRAPPAPGGAATALGLAGAALASAGGKSGAAGPPAAAALAHCAANLQPVVVGTMR